MTGREQTRREETRPAPEPELRQAIRRRTAAPAMTVDVFRARLDALGGETWPDETDTPDSLEGGDWRASGPERHLAQFDDSHVEWVLRLLDSARLAPFFDERINASKKKQGRPGTVSVLGVLVALWMCAETGRGMLSLHMRDVLFHQISPQMQARLGMRSDPVPPSPNQRLAYDLRTVASVRRKFRSMLHQIDPSPLPKNRRMSWPELERLSRDLADDDIECLQTRLDWVCNQMLEAAFRQLPRKVRRQYRGSAGIDATPLKVGVRLGNDSVCPSDPDGGVYNREGDHTDGSDTGAPRGRYERTHAVRFFAYDVHLIISSDDRPGSRQHVPALVTAMTLTRPGESPDGSARRMIASLDQRNHPKSWLAGDALYTNQKEENYQIPAMQSGRKIVMTFGDSQLGKQGAHQSGAHLIEGWYFCPAMPEDLVNATKDLRANTITRDTYKQKILDRQNYRLRRAEKENERGLERFRCPAAGDSPIAVCPFKARSEEERATRQRPTGDVVDARIEINPVNVPVSTDGRPPQICRQTSVSIHVTDNAKYRQTLQYGTDEHYSVFNLLRQSQEGEHGRVKDEAYEALGTPGKRRTRGRAAQSIFTAFMLAAASVRKIRTFLAKAEEPDPVTGDIYVLKPYPRNRKNTWNSELPDSPTPPELEPAAQQRRQQDSTNLNTGLPPGRPATRMPSASPPRPGFPGPLNP